MRRVGLHVSALAFMLVSCGSSAPKTSAPNNSLTPAAAVNAAAGAKTALAPGVLTSISKTTKFGVMSYKVVPIDSANEPVLQTEVRAEASGAEGAMPDIGVLCANSTETGGWYITSTVTMGEAVPSKSFLAGTFDLELPGHGSSRKPIENCAKPALIKVDVAGLNAKPVFYSIPDDVIDQMNAEALKFNAGLTTTTT